MKFKKGLYGRWLILVLIAVIIVLGFYFFIPKTFILPSSFLAARENAAQISQKIVDLTTATNQKIIAVNALDLKNDVDQALGSIKEARDSNNEAYAQASSLAIYLQQMAASLNNIRSPSKQQLAYEAVAIELSLVSEFIVYTQKLNSFLDALAQGITAHSFQDRQLANDYLSSVNGQAQKINVLNKEFLLKIQAFDNTQ